MQILLRFDFEGGRTKVNPNQTAEPALFNPKGLGLGQYIPGLRNLKYFQGG